ncbi:MAG TPA: SdpI family protein [Gemmatimonadaceae bacterium]|nr:SdpI family protein [Gemmatimonadaceae bacterium]
MRKWIPLVIVAAAFIASAVVYPRLPERIPTHWELSAHPSGYLPTPNGWSDRMWGAWALPIFLLGMWALVKILPKIDPRGSNYAKFGGAFEGIIVSIMLFMLGMHIIILRAALGYPVAMQRVVPVGVGVLLIVIGNLLPRARPNWFVGIRTPWTLSSDRVWEKTHRVGGQVFVAGGILIVLAALAMQQWAHVVLITVVLVCTATVLIYSYVEWKREQNPASVPR